jgi:chromatin structure-remodeling complex subunit RSC4
VEEAKKFVPDPIQVDGHPEVSRIKLKMGTSHSTQGAQRLTLKVAGQASEIPKDDRSPSGVTVDDDSLKRQQELVRTGSASQEVDTHHTSPRTRSLRRHIDSPKSSTGTTPSNFEPLHAVSAGRDASGAIKDEPPMSSSQRAELPFSSSSQPGSTFDSASGNFLHDGKAAFNDEVEVLLGTMLTFGN